MINFPLAQNLAEQATLREVNSARPHAPVVPEPARPARTRRSRIAVTSVLQRTADAVAPAECSPAR